MTTNYLPTFKSKFLRLLTIFLHTSNLIFCVYSPAGKDLSLGVENLKYSGLIAGETSRAYDEIVTMNLVSV